METVNLTFNSHEKYKALIAKGFDENQAEGIIDIFSEITFPNAATREDVRSVKNELKDEIREIKEELNDKIEDVRKDVINLESKLIKQIYINNFLLIGALTAIYKLL